MPCTRKAAPPATNGQRIRASPLVQRKPSLAVVGCTALSPRRAAPACARPPSRGGQADREPLPRPSLPSTCRHPRARVHSVDAWVELAGGLNISTVALAGVALLSLPCLAIGAAALLTLSTSFLMPLCNNYLPNRANSGTICSQSSLYTV